MEIKAVIMPLWDYYCVFKMVIDRRDHVLQDYVCAHIHMHNLYVMIIVKSGSYINGFHCIIFLLWVSVKFL